MKYLGEGCLKFNSYLPTLKERSEATSPRSSRITIHDDGGGRTASAFMFLQSDTQIEGSSTESANVLLQLLLSNRVDPHVASDLGGLE